MVRRVAWNGRPDTSAVSVSACHHLDTLRPFVQWVGEFLASPSVADVRQKLARSGFEQRHAFLVVPGFTTAPFGVVNLLMGHGVPGDAPHLPEEITHVWLVGTWNIGTGWRWDPDEGWRPFDRLQDAGQVAGHEV